MLPFYQDLFGWDCKSAVAEPTAQRQFQHFVDPKTGKPLKGPAPYLLPEYECKNGSCGHQLASYRPNDVTRKTQVTNALFCLPVSEPSAVAEFQKMADEDQAYFPNLKRTAGRPLSEEPWYVGFATYSWPQFPKVISKPNEGAEVRGRSYNQPE